MMSIIANPHFRPEPAAGTTMVVFDDHRFCAGQSTEVQVMAAPHRHSQFEINAVLHGAMTYWFDGRVVTIEAGRIALFWGMVPHRTIARPEGTRFVCLYIPSALFIRLPIGDALRTALFRGALAVADQTLETDAGNFLRWREDLLAEDVMLEAIVRDELGARLRRIDLGGWHDVREIAAPVGVPAERGGSDRRDKVEAMVRFISERFADDIAVSDVAAVAGLHPNYAMQLFKRTLGLTIADYVTRNRLDTAQALLVSSEDDIAGVAFASGFGSLSRFYEAFHARFAMSPAKFRKLHREGKR
jgi:AraC-like DNA-binding protein